MHVTHHIRTHAHKIVLKNCESLPCSRELAKLSFGGRIWSVDKDMRSELEGYKSLVTERLRGFFGEKFSEEIWGFLKTVLRGRKRRFFWDEVFLFIF